MAKELKTDSGYLGSDYNLATNKLVLNLCFIIHKLGTLDSMITKFHIHLKFYGSRKS